MVNVFKRAPPPHDNALAFDWNLVPALQLEPCTLNLVPDSYLEPGSNNPSYSPNTFSHVNIAACRSRLASRMRGSRPGRRGWHPTGRQIPPAPLCQSGVTIEVPRAGTGHPVVEMIAVAEHGVAGAQPQQYAHVDCIAWIYCLECNI
jgi:hypothetical protein